VTYLCLFQSITFNCTINHTDTKSGQNISFIKKTGSKNRGGPRTNLNHFAINIYLTTRLASLVTNHASKWTLDETLILALVPKHQKSI
jgi:hypothetical protein